MFYCQEHSLILITLIFSKHYFGQGHVDPGNAGHEAGIRPVWDTVTPSLTSRGNLESPICLPECFWEVGGNWRTMKKP